MEDWWCGGNRPLLRSQVVRYLEQTRTTPPNRHSHDMRLNVKQLFVQPKLTRVMTLLRILLGSRRATVSELKECSRSLKKKLRISLPFSSSPLRRDSQRSICGRATLTM